MTVGTRPAGGLGYALADTQWLRGMSDGNNDSFTSGIVAHAGGTQAAGVLLSNNFSLYEIDTVVSNNDSVVMPFAGAGQRKMIFNNGASTLAIYANPNNNPLTGSADVINKTSNSSSYTITSGQTVLFWCAKSGIWAANKTA